MKPIYILSFLLAFTFCGNKQSSINSNIVLKSYLNGVYNIPREIDSVYYFLIEVRLINNTNFPIEFLTMNCSTGSSLVFDSEYFKTCINNCSRNFMVPIKLIPKQEFSFTTILEANENFPDFLKIGWIFINSKDLEGIDDYFKKLKRSREELENIIWSAPLELKHAGGRSYEIR